MNIDKCNGTFKHGRSKPYMCSERWGCKWFDWRHVKTGAKPKSSATADRCSEWVDPIEHFKNLNK